MALVSGRYPGSFVGAERVLLSGNFDDQGAVEGCPGMSVTADGSGVYTVTLPGRGTVNVMGAVFTVEDTAGLHAYISSRDDAARTIEVTLQDAATPTATDLGSGDRVHFLIVVKNTDLINA